MRVLEADPSALYKMGKNKKHKIRKAKENDADDSSEDGNINGCPHLSKAVNLAAMRKTLLRPTVTFGECTGCSKEPPPKSGGRDLFGSLIEGPASASAGDDVDVQETTICVCLQCGHQGCDRNSPNKHALKHYKVPHSGLHCIIVNITTWSTWCYMCDEEVRTNGKIKSCVDFLQKQSGMVKPDTPSASGRSLDSPVADTVVASLPNSSGNKNVNTPPVSCVKVKGLSNLGNTCFFNAVMQSMCQTRGLDSILSDRSKQGRLCTIPGVEMYPESDSSASDEDYEEETADKKSMLPGIQTSLGDPGQVTMALLNFIQEMKGGTTRNGIVNPTSLFAQVCKKAPRFKGFQQQDSHELLRYLVDSVRTEEIKRGQASILKHFKLPETTNPKKVDEDVKMKVKEYGRQVKHTFLDSMFGGQLVSTVKCEECKSISQIFEAFLDLSLPVMEEKPQRPNFVQIGKKKDHVVIDGTDEARGGASGGIDLDAYAERPSKYQERKNKRLAKKDSKKKLKLQISKSQDGKDPTEVKADQEAEVEGSDVKPDPGTEKNVPESSTTLAVDQSLTPGRQIRSVMTPQSSNTSVDSITDVTKEGGKVADKCEEQDQSDDPSDADIEDNVETDMSKAGSFQHMHKFTPSLLCNNTTNTLPNVEDNNNHSTCMESKSVGSLEKDTSAVHASATVNSTNSSTKGPGVAMTNGELWSNSTDHVESGEASLCEGLCRVSVSAVPGGTFSGVDGSSISADVSVTNRVDPTQVLQLAYGRGSLTVHDGETTSTSHTPATPAGVVRDINNKHPVMSETTEACTNGHIINVASNSVRPSECQVYATFTLNLPVPCAGNNHRAAKFLPPVEQVTAGNNIIPKPETKEDNQPDGDRMRESEKDADSAAAKQSSTDIIEDKKQAQDCKSKLLHKSRQEILREARSCSMSTLAPRYHPAPKECSILSCLNQFTAAELLTGSNKFGCKECTRRRRHTAKTGKATSGEKKTKDTVYSNASKQYLIFRPPAVLTLHLKRFEQTGLTSRKVNRHVDFPLVLDLAPYCSSLSLGVSAKQSKVLYSLYAVVEHSGRLSGGHYTAYIKVRPGLASHTQFLHTQPPSPHDLLNVYLSRVEKAREASGTIPVSMEADGPSVDQELHIHAEALVPPGRWFHISDSRVNEVTEAVVLKAQAYLLFYERIC